MQIIEFITLGLVQQSLLVVLLLGVCAGVLYIYWRGLQARRPIAHGPCLPDDRVLADRLEQVCRAHTCASDGATADFTGRLETVCRVHTVKI
ncbi:MAG: hypothetical protein OHK0022_36100 [Roseiflexaceae bacterium]